MSNERDSQCQELSNAARWVMAYLETYCAPGTHTLRDVGPGGWEWCTRCYKEQRSDGTSCLVCDQPGVVVVEVVSKLRSGSLRGSACQDCLAGLAEIHAEFHLRPLPGALQPPANTVNRQMATLKMS